MEPMVKVSGDGNDAFQQEIREAAAQLLRDLPRRFFASELSAWSQPATVRIRFDATAGAGATEFQFNEGKLIYPIEAVVSGLPERILADVVPHEVCHMVLAAGFQRPVPRWLDEGLAVYQESNRAKNVQWSAVNETLRAGDTLPLGALFDMEDYPANLRAFYSEAWSTAEFLIAQSDEAYLCELAADRFDRGHWNWRTFFGYSSASAVQDAWEDWVQYGAPQVPEPETVARPRDGHCQLCWRWSTHQHAWLRTRPSGAEVRHSVSLDLRQPTSAALLSFPGTLSFASHERLR